MEHYKKEMYIVAAENDAERLKWCNRAFDDEVDDLNITTDDGYSTSEYDTLVSNVNRALSQAAYDFATLRDGVGLASAQSSSSDFTTLAKNFADRYWNDGTADPDILRTSSVNRAAVDDRTLYQQCLIDS